MRGEDLREGKEVEGLDYRFEFEGKEIRVRTEWREHKRLYLPVQKHTNRVITLTAFPYPTLIGDAVITNLRNVEIGVRTADCAPVVAIGREWIGIAHVGWRGLTSGILERFVERLRSYEDTEKIFFFVGPCAKGCCYEVGSEFRNIFPSYVFERDGKLYMDLQDSVVKELKALGAGSVGTLEKCTICSENLPSYRRDKTEERILTSVRKL